MPTSKRTGKVKLRRTGFVFHRDKRQQKRQAEEDEVLSRKRLQYRGMAEFSAEELAELEAKLRMWDQPAARAWRRAFWSTAKANV